MRIESVALRSSKNVASAYRRDRLYNAELTVIDVLRSMYSCGVITNADVQNEYVFDADKITKSRSLEIFWVDKFSTPATSQSSTAEQGSLLSATGCSGVFPTEEGR